MNFLSRNPVKCQGKYKYIKCFPITSNDKKKLMAKKDGP